MSSEWERIKWLIKKALANFTDNAKETSSFYIENPGELWEDIKAWCCENKWTCVLILGGAAALIIPVAIGFGPGGIAAGSLAAAWQSSMGGAVAAGSFFAVLQSAAMTGTFITAGVTMIGMGIGAQLSKALRWLWGNVCRYLGSLWGSITGFLGWRSDDPKIEDKDDDSDEDDNDGGEDDG